MTERASVLDTGRVILAHFQGFGKHRQSESVEYVGDVQRQTGDRQVLMRDGL